MYEMQQSLAMNNLLGYIVLFSVQKD